MKKFRFLAFTTGFVQLSAQNETVTNTISVSLPAPSKRFCPLSMQSWNRTNWHLCLLCWMMIHKTKASYALNAMNQVASDAEKKNRRLPFINRWTAAQSLCKDFIIQQLGLLGDNAAVKLLAKLLGDEVYAGNAARALASIQSEASVAALNKALTKAKDPARKHIQAAIDNVNKPLPDIKVAGNVKTSKQNPVQYILALQDRMDAAKTSLQKKNILSEAAHIAGFSSFMFVSKSLNDPEINHDAALITTRLALADKDIRGPVVRETLEKALPLIKGEDSALLVKNIMAHLKAMPYDNGFVSLLTKRSYRLEGSCGQSISRSKCRERITGCTKRFQ